MIRDELAVQAWMDVDLGALRDNYREIRRRAGAERKIIAVIKANAYGHGAVEVSRGLSDLDVHALATGSFSDAVSVRRAGVTTPILLLGSPPPHVIPELRGHDLMPSLDSPEAAQAVSEAVGNGTSPVFIKVDAGFGRFGVPLERTPAFIRQVADLPGMVIEGIYTHLPFSDDRGSDWSRRRIVAFEEMISGLKADGWRIPVTQAVASPGVVCGLTDGCTAVACGSLLHGLAPAASGIGDMSGIRPLVRSIGTRLLHATNRPDDGNRETDAEYLRHGVRATGTVPLGMNAGYPTPAPGRTAYMLLRGRRVPVLRVCLENSILDLSAIDEPSPGEEVLALGGEGNEAITLDGMASAAALGPLDLLTSFDGRLSRRYLGR